MRIILAGAALLLAAGCSATNEPPAHKNAASTPAPHKTATETATHGPRSGYCAVLVFRGRNYEIADGQQGSGVARPVGKAHGRNCGAGGDTEVAVYTANEQPAEEALTASYGDRVVVYWPQHSSKHSPVPYPATVRQSGEVTGKDLALVRRFAQFAVRPIVRYRNAVGFVARGPEIGLGPNLHRTPVSDLAAESAWSLPANGFAGAEGQINVLDVLRDHLLDTLFIKLLTAPKVVPDLLVWSGDHARCVGPAVKTPSGLAHMRHLSLEPDPETIGSCLDWFAIDLYLDSSGRVEAVSLDLREP